MAQSAANADTKAIQKERESCLKDLPKRIRWFFSEGSVEALYSRNLRVEQFSVESSVEEFAVEQSPLQESPTQ